MTRDIPMVFPKGVDKLMALLDMLAGWQYRIDDCVEVRHTDQNGNPTTNLKWAKPHSEAYFTIVFELYQTAGALMVLPEDEQNAAVEVFVRDSLVPLFTKSGFFR